MSITPGMYITTIIFFLSLLFLVVAMTKKNVINKSKEEMGIAGYDVVQEISSVCDDYISQMDKKSEELDFKIKEIEFYYNKVRDDEEKNVVVSDNAKSLQVISLKAEGHSVEEISKQLDLDKGYIRFVINLSDMNSGNKSA